MSNPTATAILMLRPDAQFTLSNGRLSDWFGPGDPPTDAEIAAAMPQAKAAAQVSRDNVARVETRRGIVGDPADFAYDLALRQEITRRADGDTDLPLLTAIADGGDIDAAAAAEKARIGVKMTKLAAASGGNGGRDG